MAKKTSVVNMSLLAAIAAGTVTHVSKADGLPLVSNQPPLIDVNTNDIDASGNAAVRLTDAGKALINKSGNKPAATADHPIYAIIGGFIPPAKVRKGRGGGGAKTIYPWATLDVGGSFFVAVSTDKPDPVKSMTSAVSSANMKYSEEVGEPKPKMVNKRVDGKIVEGTDGKPEKVEVMRRDRQQLRKFEVYPVTKGTAYGDWMAESDGAMVVRVS